MALCGGCHDINRARAGYTPEGWHTVMRMMLNFGAPVSKDQVDTLTDYLIKSFPERPRPAAVIVDGPVKATIKQWQVPTPGSRPHDPLAAQGRRDLVHRTTVRQARPPRPEDRRDQGISAQDAADRSARPGRGQGRQHLVHRQPHEPRRQARPQDRQRDRIQDARSQGEGSAHHRHRPERDRVVHGPERQHAGPDRSQAAARSSW